MPIETRIHTLTTVATARAEELAASARSVTQRDPNEHCLVIFGAYPDDPGLLATIVRGIEALAVSGWSGPNQFRNGFQYGQWFIDRTTPEIAEQIRQQLISPARSDL